MIKLAELRRMLGGDDVVPVTENANLVALEKAAVEFVQTQTRRYFGPVKDFEEVITGTGAEHIWLRAVPVDQPDFDYTSAIVSVDERQYPDSVPLAIEDFEVLPLDGEVQLVRHGGGLWTDGMKYVVTYRMGYEPGTEPADIRQLVKDLVAHRWSSMGREGLKSETLGGYSYTAFDFDTEDLTGVPGGDATIRAYRRLVIA